MARAPPSVGQRRAARALVCRTPRAPLQPWQPRRTACSLAPNAAMKTPASSRSPPAKWCRRSKGRRTPESRSSTPPEHASSRSAGSMLAALTSSRFGIQETGHCLFDSSVLDWPRSRAVHLSPSGDRLARVHDKYDVTIETFGRETLPKLSNYSDAVHDVRFSPRTARTSWSTQVRASTSLTRGRRLASRASPRGKASRPSCWRFRTTVPCS